MKKIMLPILFTVLFQIIAASEPSSNLEKGWLRIYVKDFGHFDLPPTLDVQKAKYKTFLDKDKGISGYDTNSFVAQEKKSSSGKSINNNPAKIILETTISSDGEYSKLNSNFNGISQRQIEDLNKSCRKAIMSNPANGTVTEWYPMKIENVNGMSCMHYSYKRHFKNQPTEIVHHYGFHNNDRIHDLEISYVASEIKWKNDFAKFLDSFTITNIK
jgi:hypothetical protein